MDPYQNDDLSFLERLINLVCYRASMLKGLRFISVESSCMHSLLLIVDKALYYHFEQGCLRYHRQSNKTDFLNQVIRDYRRPGRNIVNYMDHHFDDEGNLVPLNEAIRKAKELGIYLDNGPSKGKERRDQVDVMRSNKYRYFNY